MSHVEGGWHRVVRRSRGGRSRRGGVPGGVGVDGLAEIGVAAHAVAVAADVDDVAAVQEPVEESGGHDLVTEDPAPLLEALVGGEHGRCVLVSAVDELEEERGSALGDREIADLVDDQQRRVREGLEAPVEVAGGPGLLEEVDKSGQGAVVDRAAALGGGDGKRDGQDGS